MAAHSSRLRYLRHLLLHGFAQVKQSTQDRKDTALSFPAYRLLYQDPTCEEAVAAHLSRLLRSDYLRHLRPRVPLPLLGISDLGSRVDFSRFGDYDLGSGD